MLNASGVGTYMPEKRGKNSPKMSAQFKERRSCMDDLERLKIAYKKLKSNVFFDKTQLPLRDRLVQDEAKIEKLLSELNASLFDNDVLQKLRIAVGNVELSENDLRCALDRRPVRSYERYAELRKVMNEAIENGVHNCRERRNK